LLELTVAASVNKLADIVEKQWRTRRIQEGLFKAATGCLDRICTVLQEKRGGKNQVNRLRLVNQ
jgi:hypothetical protein